MTIGNRTRFTQALVNAAKKNVTMVAAADTTAQSSSLLGTANSTVNTAYGTPVSPGILTVGTNGNPTWQVISTSDYTYASSDHPYEADRRAKIRFDSEHIEFMKKFGCVIVQCEDIMPSNNGQKGHTMIANIDVDKFLSILHPTLISQDTNVVGCSEDMMRQLGEIVANLKNLSNEIERTIDYLADTMLGNNDLSNLDKNEED